MVRFEDKDGNESDLAVKCLEKTDDDTQNETIENEIRVLRHISRYRTNQSNVDIGFEHLVSS